MSKKVVLIISGIGLILFVLSILFLTNNMCSTDVWVQCRQIDESIDLISTLLLFTIPMFLFSLVTYFLREEVFRTWIRFTLWWVPLSFVIILFSSSRQSANIVGLSDQAIFGTLAFGLYVLISLIIIAWKYSATRRK